MVHQSCIVSVAAVASAHAQTANPARPNVVVIMTDDMGYADVGSYGASDIRTPNIDSLARDGIRLTDFYSNGVLCSPTRAGFISGRYQQRYGAGDRARQRGDASGERGLRAAGFSMPQLLRNHGYATALVGSRCSRIATDLRLKPEATTTSRRVRARAGGNPVKIDATTHRPYWSLICAG